MTLERENYLIEKMRELKAAVPRLKSRIVLNADFQRIEIMYSNRVPLTLEEMAIIKSLPFVKSVYENMLDYIVEV